MYNKARDASQLGTVYLFPNSSDFLHSKAYIIYVGK